MAEDASDGGVSMASLGGARGTGRLAGGEVGSCSWGSEVLRPKSCARHAQVTPSKDRLRPPTVHSLHVSTPVRLSACPPLFSVFFSERAPAPRRCTTILDI